MIGCAFCTMKLGFFIMILTIRIEITLKLQGEGLQPPKATLFLLHLVQIAMICLTRICAF